MNVKEITVPFLDGFVFARFPQLKPLRKLQGLTCLQLQSEYGMTSSQCNNFIENIQKLGSSSTLLKQDTINAVSNLLSMYNMLSGNSKQSNINSAQNTHDRISSQLSTNLHHIQNNKNKLFNLF